MANHRCGVEIGGSACLSPLLGIGLTFFKRCITMMGGPFFFKEMYNHDGQTFFFKEIYLTMMG